MDSKRKSLIADLVVGLVVMVAVVALNWAREYPISQLLCDGFFVAAVLLLGIGGIKYVRNQGGFDVASFGLRSAVHTMLPFVRSNSEHADEKFLDYQARKRGERKTATPELISGGIYMALSLIMLAIYQLSK